MNQPAVVEHRQIEATAVPRHDLRRVFFNTIKEPLDQRRLAISRIADRPHAHAVTLAQHTGDGDHAVQVQLQKITAGGLAPALEGHRRDIGIDNLGTEFVERAQAGDIRHGLDIEYQYGRH